MRPQGAEVTTGTKDPELAEPEPEVADPEAEAFDPEAEVADPEAEAFDPEAEVADPEAEPFDPDELEDVAPVPEVETVDAGMSVEVPLGPKSPVS